METKKQIKSAVLIYMLLLLTFGVVNFLNRGNIVDLIYVVIVLCCIFKYLKCLNRK